ncbi:MAG: tetratricopeptide repeat protein [Flavobacteriales bacterium]|nr:tetratricopeptide repeat protein [Flavobacteriales bacterium]
MKHLMAPLLIAFAFAPVHAAAQQPYLDSLWTLWRDTSNHDTIRLRAMHLIAWDGYLFTQPDSAYYFAQLEYDLAERKGRKKEMANALNVQGISFQDRGDLARSIDYYMRSLALQEEIGNKRGIANALGNIGTIYSQQKDLHNSIVYYTRCLAMQEEIGDERGVSLSLGNIANGYYEMGDTAKAMEFYQRSLELKEKLNDARGVAMALGNIARFYYDTKDHPRALDHYQRSLSIHTELGDGVGIAAALTSIGVVHQSTGDNTRAIAFGLRGLSAAQEVNNAQHIEEAANLLYTAYKAMGNNAQALKMHELYIATRDRVNSEKNQREVMRQEYKYTYEKEALADSLQHTAELVRVESEKTIEQLRADRNRNRALATGGGAFLLLAGGSAWFYTDRKRRRERFEKEAATLETQALRSQMNPHFIFNALNSIGAYVQRNDADNAISYLTKFARVMRSVLENSRHSQVPLQDDLDTLRGYMELERKRMQEKFDFTITVDPDIDPETILVPPLVVQPFVENAIWHGMAGKEGNGHITLKVSKHGEQLRWTIEDNGAGRHARKDPATQPTSGEPVKKTSLGTTITRSRLDLVQKQHGGQAGFRYEDLAQGTRVVVDMPVITD